MEGNFLERGKNQANIMRQVFFIFGSFSKDLFSYNRPSIDKGGCRGKREKHFLFPTQEIGAKSLVVFSMSLGVG
jgi:hypothetical protein